ncbi:unnamed protein product [Amoebophrya sp. A25]|nr:unnamed protein product [Amoebophrya sp. A25]|eukprot:GSA25T00016217001.1
MRRLRKRKEAQALKLVKGVGPEQGDITAEEEKPDDKDDYELGEGNVGKCAPEALADMDDPIEDVFDRSIGYHKIEARVSPKRRAFTKSLQEKLLKARGGKRKKNRNMKIKGANGAANQNQGDHQTDDQEQEEQQRPMSPEEEAVARAKAEAHKRRKAERKRFRKLMEGIAIAVTAGKWVPNPPRLLLKENSLLASSKPKRKPNYNKLDEDPMKNLSLKEQEKVAYNALLGGASHEAQLAAMKAIRGSEYSDAEIEAFVKSMSHGPEEPTHAQRMHEEGFQQRLLEAGLLTSTTSSSTGSSSSYQFASTLPSTGSSGPPTKKSKPEMRAAETIDTPAKKLLEQKDVKKGENGSGMLLSSTSTTTTSSSSSTSPSTSTSSLISTSSGEVNQADSNHVSSKTAATTAGAQLPPDAKASGKAAQARERNEHEIEKAYVAEYRKYFKDNPIPRWGAHRRVSLHLPGRFIDEVSHSHRGTQTVPDSYVPAIRSDLESWFLHGETKMGRQPGGLNAINEPELHLSGRALVGYRFFQIWLSQQKASAERVPPSNVIASWSMDATGKIRTLNSELRRLSRVADPNIEPMLPILAKDPLLQVHHPFTVRQALNSWKFETAAFRRSAGIVEESLILEMRSIPSQMGFAPHTWWDCERNCQYSCVLQNHAERVFDKEFVVKYNGRWAFRRAGGVQEFFSVLFSIWNMLPHFYELVLVVFAIVFGPQGKPIDSAENKETSNSGGIAATKATTLPFEGYRVFQCSKAMWHFLGVNAFLQSAIFHANETEWTLYVDVLSVQVAVGFSIWMALMFDTVAKQNEGRGPSKEEGDSAKSKNSPRSKNKLAVQNNGLKQAPESSATSVEMKSTDQVSTEITLWGTLCSLVQDDQILLFVTLPCALVVVLCLFRLIIEPVPLVLMAGAFSAVLYLLLPLASRCFRHMFVEEAACPIVLFGAFPLAIVYEVLDFPPSEIHMWIDAHAMWHLSSVPIQFYWPYFFNYMEKCLTKAAEQTPKKELTSSTS